MIALFAVVAFALLLVAAFVIDVGNWQEHRRHLQVDNGAKSAGTYFTNCFLDPAGSNANIRREARKFAGDPQFTTTFPGNGVPYNLQVDDPERVVLNLNRSEWPQAATPGIVGDDFQDDYDLDPTVDVCRTRRASRRRYSSAPRIGRCPRSSAASCPARRSSSTSAQGSRRDRRGDRDEGLPALGGARGPATDRCRPDRERGSNRTPCRVSTS